MTMTLTHRFITAAAQTVCLFFGYCFSVAAQPLDEAALKQQWQDYFERSAKVARQDRVSMQRELRITGKKKPVPPPEARHFGFDPEQPPAFYRTDAGRLIADIILSFQTPSGGWSKHVDMSQRPRRKGEGFGLKRGYTPTFDNHATTTQLHVLARAFSAEGNSAYREGFLKGLNLLLQAQFPNGGWPQSYPLDGGYHDYITYNDTVVVNILQLLRRVADGEPGYDFVPRDLRERAKMSFLNGINCILMTQVNSNGVFTIWGAQHDPFSLQPQAARAFEPAALATRESLDILGLLMSLEDPPAVVVQAVDDAVAWFEASKLSGLVWDREAAALVADEKAAPLWARFYEPGSNRPVYGDRDGKVHYDISRVSEERRRGYGWFTTGPNKLLKRHAGWKAALKPGKSGALTN